MDFEDLPGTISDRLRVAKALSDLSPEVLKTMKELPPEWLHKAASFTHLGKTGWSDAAKQYRNPVVVQQSADDALTTEPYDD